MRSVKTTSLAELVANRMPAMGIESGRELAVRCGMGKDTALSILAGRRPSPTEPTLRKLADGLALPIQVVRQAAGRSRGERTPFVAPKAWDGLPSAHRELLYRMGSALLQASTPSLVGGDIVADISTHGRQSRFAARHDEPNARPVQAIFRDGQ